MIPESVQLAMVVAVPSVLSPVILALIVSWSNGRTKRLDWARQDQVADRLIAANERVAKDTRITNQKLDVIHTLVNSNMTAAMQSEYDATVRELAMMQEVLALKRTAGAEPSIEALAAIDATNTKIGELLAKLNDRARQQAIVNQQPINSKNSAAMAAITAVADKLKE